MRGLGLANSLKATHHLFVFPTRAGIPSLGQMGPAPTIARRVHSLSSAAPSDRDTGALMFAPRAPGGVLRREAGSIAGGFGLPATNIVGGGSGEGMGPPQGKAQILRAGASFSLHRAETPLGLGCARGAARPLISSLPGHDPLGGSGGVARTVASRSLPRSVRSWGTRGAEPSWPSWMHSASGLWSD